MIRKSCRANKNITSLYLIITICILLLPTSINKATISKNGSNQSNVEWISLDGSGDIKQPKFTVLNVNENEIIFNLDLYGFFSENIMNGSAIFQKLTFQGCGKTAIVGLPQLPTFLRYFAALHHADIHLEILSTNFTILNNYSIWPVQEPYPDLYGAETEFCINDTHYLRDEFYPNITAINTISWPVRGVNISHLLLFPLKYNAASQELKAYTKIKCRIWFTGGTGEYCIPERRSRYFEPIYKNMLINYAMLNPQDLIRSGANINSTDYDYLIIVEDSLYNNILPLAEWRKKIGLKTKIIKTSEIAGSSPTEDDIRSFIISETVIAPSLSFLLLVGDSDHIPVFYHTTHPAERKYYNKTNSGTDLYYTCFYSAFCWSVYPELHGGRISVDDASQLDIVVDKILTYEKNPPIGTTWFNDVLLAAYDQTGKSYIDESEDIFAYLDSIGYDHERVYEDDPNHDGDTQDVIDAINNGVFLVNHRDHGNSPNNNQDNGTNTGWTHPWFRTTHLANLTNGYRLPVMFSINCESGWFDGEIDENQPGGDIFQGINFESLAEVFLRDVDGGVVGMVAATRISYMERNEYINKGLIDAIWPDFETAYPTANDTNPWGSNPVPIYHMGAVLNYAKYFYYDQMATFNFGCPTQYARTMAEIFHWHGDPAMQIWTQEPDLQDVEYGTSIFHYFDGSIHYFSNQMIVTVEDSGGSPVEKATLTLYRDSPFFYLLGTTDNTGEEIFVIPSTDDGYVNFTSSKHNFIPYEKEVVIDQSPPNSTVYIGNPSYIFLGQRWINYSTPIIFSAYDNGNPPSGVKEIQYSFNNENWFSMDPPYILKLNNEEPQWIYYRAEDNVDNTELANSLYVYVDNSPPVSTLETSLSSIDPDVEYVYINSTDKPEDPWNPTDSGVDKIFYRIINVTNDTGWLESTHNVTFTVSSNSIQIIQYYAVDNLKQEETINNKILSKIKNKVIQAPKKFGTLQLNFIQQMISLMYKNRNLPHGSSKETLLIYLLIQ